MASALHGSIEFQTTFYETQIKLQLFESSKSSLNPNLKLKSSHFILINVNLYPFSAYPINSALIYY